MPASSRPAGAYTIEATLSGADGRELAADSEAIEIGKKGATVIHEITTKTAIDKGGMELLTAWAEARNAKILNDLLPGMFGPYYQMTARRTRRFTSFTTCFPAAPCRRATAMT